MKKINLRMAVIVMIVAIGLVMMSCDDTTPPRDPLYESHSDYAIQVSNLSNVDLVAFSGSLTAANRIGGIPAKSSNHGLQRNTTFFPSTPRSFQMLFITRADYEANLANLGALTNKVYIRTYVFWNGTAGDNTKVYEISEKLGGMHRLQIFGPGNYDVEFRENGIAGPTIGYAPSKMSLTYLSVDAGDYFIFPVFQRYNTRRDIMETIIPIRPAQGNIPEGPFNYSFSFSPAATTQQTRMLNLNDASNSLSKMQTGVVYVYVNNALQSGQGIRAYRGSIPMMTPHGNYIIDAGDFQEFAILLPQQGTAYMPSLTTSFSIMVGSTGVDVVSAQTASAQNPTKSFTLLADKMYTIDIQPINGVQATIELREGQTGGPTAFEPDDPVTGLTS